MLEDIFYFDYWYNIVIVLVVVYSIYLVSKSSSKLIYGDSGWVVGLIVSFWVAITFGIRSEVSFCDTKLYSTMFYLLQSGAWDSLNSVESEWLWDQIEYFFVDYSTCRMWFVFISFCYVGFIAISTYRWIPNHFTLAMIFAFTAMSFIAYGTNGIRNGMATSVALLGLSLIFAENRKPKIGFVILYLSCAIHSSLFAVFAAVIMSYFFKNVKVNTYIWLFCIVLSVLFSDYLMALATAYVGDMRMSYYTNIGGSSRIIVGFRWDFIIYGSIPILIGWVVCVKNNIKDYVYEHLLTVYTIVNAGWVLINPIAFSNRFAYLSWFMYPILIAYPLLKFHFLPNQNSITAFTLIFYLVFMFYV